MRVFGSIRIAGIAGIAALLACSGSGATDTGDTPGTLGPGKWGGPSVGLEITATEAKAHFDFCADGTLKVPVLLTPDGRFDVAGTYVRNIGPSVQARSARYVGLWRGSSMTLTVLLSDPIGPNDSDVVGPFDLKAGAAGPPIRPCPIVY
ncbi:MAG TPA: hypothetical protein VM076_04040 [Gemmatimonadaceae bacterium]|nr:hypothetical protein [Gemmatimonadaceae bacterium]